MSSDFLAVAPLWYVAFLFSTVCHEAAHALVAKWGGDFTAYAGGQVTLDPMPHIKREPFGLVIFPIISLLSSGSMLGWGSAPYDPLWQIRYPKRAALMALAGPLTNFTIAVIAALSMHAGVAAGLFVPISDLTVTSVHGGLTEGLGQFMSILLLLNILLGVFNLLPIPPLDGYSVLGLILPERLFLNCLEFARNPGFSILGLIVAMNALPHLMPFVLRIAGGMVRLLPFF